MKICSVEGCERLHKSKGMCAYHYRRHYYQMNREHEIRTATERAKQRKPTKRGAGSVISWCDKRSDTRFGWDLASEPSLWHG